MKKVSVKNILSVSVILSVVFTVLDFVGHKYIEVISVVPSNYFLNKFLYSIVLFFVILYFLRKQNIFVQALVFNVLLQARYYFITSTQFFVVSALLHYIILVSLFYLIDKEMII